MIQNPFHSFGPDVVNSVDTDVNIYIKDSMDLCVTITVNVFFKIFMSFIKSLAELLIKGPLKLLMPSQK